MIEELKEVENKTSRDVELWLDNILEGYIDEFIGDTTKSYNEVGREFFNESRGRFLLSLQFSIKMIIYEKLTLKMNTTK